MRGVNKVLKRVGHPLDGSSHILKGLNKYYAVLDLSMGYFQVELHPEARNLFAIVLYVRLYAPRCRSSSDLFNIHIDPELKGRCGVYKNVDNILTAAPSHNQLVETMEAVLKVYLQRNMKLTLQILMCPPSDIRRSDNKILQAEG